MNIREFAEKIKKAVAKKMGETYQVEIREVRKNNNILLYGVVIMEKEHNVSPTIYLNSFLEAYESGVTFSEIVEKIVDAYERDVPRERINMSFFNDFENVKDRICFKIIHAGKNEHLLQGVPHIISMDLALCFFYAYQGEALGNGSVLIHNSHMKLWGVDQNVMWNCALKNTPKLFPAQSAYIDEVLKEMLDHDEKELLTDDSVSDIGGTHRLSMKILSNESKVNGAACIFYPGVVEEIAKEMACNLFILPSSIHEGATCFAV